MGLTQVRVSRSGIRQHPAERNKPSRASGILHGKHKPETSP